MKTQANAMFFNYTSKQIMYPRWASNVVAVVLKWQSVGRLEADNLENKESERW